MAYGLPASAWLEKGCPSPETSSKVPPKLALARPALACGSEAVCTRGMTNSAAIPTTASITSAQASSLTRLSVSLVGAGSVTSDHHAQVGAAFRRVERAYRPAVRQRNLPRKAQAHAAATFVRRIEGQEDVVAPRLGNAGAVVAHLDSKMTGGFAGKAEHDQRTVQACPPPGRVAEEVEERLGEQLRICGQAHGLRLDLDPRLDLAFLGIGEGEPHDFLSPWSRLELAAVDVRRAREFAVALDEAKDALGTPRDGLGCGLRVRQRVVALGRSRDEVGASPRKGRDRRQRIHDLVSQH